MLPDAVRVLPAVTWTAAFAVMAALAVMVAPDAKVVADLTVRLLLDLLPSTVLPRALKL